MIDDKTYYTVDQFDEIFEPYSFGDNDEITFNTLDDLKEFAKDNKIEYDYQNIWTAIDGDTKPILVNGYHYVNKFGYVLSGNKWGVGDARDNVTYIEVEY